MTKDIYNTWYNSTHLQSYNALFNFINSNRNIGKTWAFKMRALQRFKKHHKKTCWVRYYTEDIKATKEKFFDSKILKAMNESADNFVLKGRYLYYKPLNDWFIEFVALSKQKKYKSIDDERLDTIVFDEYTETIEKLRYYRGNIVIDFLDLRKSKQRNHNLLCFFLGNNEAVYNPFFMYFDIAPLDKNFTGIKTYRHNTICVENIPKLPTEVIESEVFKRDKLLFEGTSYGDYLENGAVKTPLKSLINDKPPRNLTFIAFFDIGYIFALGSDENGKIYAINTFDNTRPLIFTDKPTNKYKRVYIIKGFEKRFESIKRAYKYNNLVVTDDYTQEATTKLLSLLRII